MFKKVNPKQNFPKMEKEIMNFWKENKIFEKSTEQKSKEKTYSFFDGPPFATGLPHYGHIVASLIKDVVPRYWTMKGYKVERRWGWDCHGLPIENLIEKEHNIKNKQDIEKWGVDKFNEACHASVLRYADEWKKFIPRIGRWVDMENDYRTMDWKYTESIWWVFSELYKKGLIYEGYKAMHLCPRCETTLSNFEVTLGYKEITDLSATVKFKLKKESANKLRKKILKQVQDDKSKTQDEDVYVLAWTTTPWTLPGNVALAVREEIKYVLVQFFNNEKKYHEYLILAKNKFEDKKGEYDINSFYRKMHPLASRNTSSEISMIIEEFKGKDLVGLEYEPLFDYYFKKKDLKDKENGWKIYAADFVSTKEGTGIVHIAPAFGEDDMKMGQEYKLPFIQHVKMNGRFTDEVVDFREGTRRLHSLRGGGLWSQQRSKKAPQPPRRRTMEPAEKQEGSTASEAEDYGASNIGLEVKPKRNPRETDEKIVKWLEDNNKLFSKENYKHSYPHCWRCDTPLLNYATSSWFVKVTAIKDKMVKNNQKIKWVPSYIKDGRFGKWLEDARDWAISRNRFWGAPLPVWRCGNENCKRIQVVDSVEQLKKLSINPVPEIPDLHRPFIDNYHFNCPNCNSGIMTRVEDVFDCWFESGSMPYAQWHYPFENKDKFEKSFPADFIAEGLDQTRGWFYTLIVLSTALFDKPAFKNVIVNGIVLAEGGQKMSKRLKNYPEPNLLIEKYGADALRYYLLTSPVMKAENLNFSEKGVEEILKRFILILWNSYSFFVMNARITTTSPSLHKEGNGSDNLLDRWILSELNILIQEVNKQMENYDLVKASRPIREFMDKLSNWYIRRSRKRFTSEDARDKRYAFETLYYILTEYSKLIAPFMPFLAEEMYKNLTSRKSVHLEEYPKAVKDLIDRRINEKMDFVRDIVALGLAIRAKSRLKVRQPLQKLEVKIWKLLDRSSFVEKTVEKMFKLEIKNELLELIKDELNVKEVEFVDEIVEKNGWLYEEDDKIKVGLKIEITDELKAEGSAREIVRHIQAMRKEAKYNRDDLISVKYNFIEGGEEIKRVFDIWEDYIKKECLAEKISFADELIAGNFDLVKELELGNYSLEIGIRK